MWLVFAMYMVFASSFPLTKVLLAYAGPLFLTGTRMIAGGGLLLGYHIGYKRRSCAIAPHHYGIYVHITVVGIYLNYVARFWALTHLTSIKTSYLFNAAPLVASFLSYRILGETLSKFQWLGLVCAFSSLVPTVLVNNTGAMTTQALWSPSLPELAMLFSIVADCYKWVLLRKLVLDRSCSPIMANGLCMFFGGLLALATSMFVEGSWPVSSSGPFVSYLAMYVIISNVILYNFYSYLLRHYTATFLALAGFITPVFATLYGRVFLNEKSHWLFYISMVILAVGLYLFYHDEVGARLENRLSPVQQWLRRFRSAFFRC